MIENTLTVYYCRSDAFADEETFEKLKMFLPNEVRERLEQFKNAKARAESFAAWLLAEYAFEKLNIKNIGLSFSEHGKPYLKENELFFNISHTDSLSFCAVGKTEMGIDAEKIRSYDRRIERRVLSENELNLLNESENREEEFFRLWTLKEAYSKYTGQGLSIGFSSLDFSQVICGEKEVYLDCRVYCEKIQDCCFSACFNGKKAVISEVLPKTIKNYFLLR